MIAFVFSIALIAPMTSFSCELPKGEVIRVGCSYDCDFFYRFRINMTAWALGYSTEFINLNNRSDLKDAMSEVDGILLPGGADIDPKYYLESISDELRDYTKKNLKLVNFTSEGRARDPFEYELVKTYSDDEKFANLPMLGVCRGLQMMSVAQGIPLYLDIKTELGIKNRYNKFDEVSPQRDSLIDHLYGSASFRGFKYHHQGIRVPYFLEHQSHYPMTRLTAFSNNRKIAEAIEYTHRPALGVQYHPERSFFGASIPIFKWFLNKACEHKVLTGKAQK